MMLCLLILDLRLKVSDLILILCPLLIPLHHELLLILALLSEPFYLL